MPSSQLEWRPPLPAHPLLERVTQRWKRVMPVSLPEPCEVLKSCPLCEGIMDTAYHTREQFTCICRDCKTTVSVPAAAWAVLRSKREPVPAPPELRRKPDRRHD